MRSLSCVNGIYCQISEIKCLVNCLVNIAISDNDGHFKGSGREEVANGAKKTLSDSRRNNRDPSAATLEISSFFKQRFNQLLSSNERTQRHLLEQELAQKPLAYPGNEMQVK